VEDVEEEAVAVVVADEVFMGEVADSEAVDSGAGTEEEAVAFMEVVVDIVLWDIVAVAEACAGIEDLAEDHEWELVEWALVERVLVEQAHVGEQVRDNAV
jgi:hypothetical protein